MAIPLCLFLPFSAFSKSSASSSLSLNFQDLFVRRQGQLCSLELGMQPRIARNRQPASAFQRLRLQACTTLCLNLLGQLLWLRIFIFEYVCSYLKVTSSIHSPFSFHGHFTLIMISGIGIYVYNLISECDRKESKLSPKSTTDHNVKIIFL